MESKESQVPFFTLNDQSHGFCRHTRLLIGFQYSMQYNMNQLRFNRSIQYRFVEGMSILLKSSLIMIRNNLSMYLSSRANEFPYAKRRDQTFQYIKRLINSRQKFILKFDNDNRGLSQSANNDKSITITHKINQNNFNYINMISLFLSTISVVDKQ